jgi:hypothetical protein
MVNSPSSFAGFLTGMMEMGAYDDKDYQLLQDSANQEPINKGYTSHLQRANKALKAQEGEQEEDGAAERKIKMQRRERAEERVAARVRKSGLRPKEK